MLNYVFHVASREQWENADIVYIQEIPELIFFEITSWPAKLFAVEMGLINCISRIISMNNFLQRKSIEVLRNILLLNNIIRGG